ncbi:AEC family transporter [Cupriavidus basilensis]|uniref:AEC family transporter n=1 Tax=Cupriavidus basilensis TaxID=68895 RepID=A0ABT6B529_9BURK|nr:AEC family transporter [Cupriavidus basilensis]MDF3839547.1 AEC family transporter [Cupriavidus basilensis]
MLAILAIVAPIYIVILIGFAMTRSGLFAKADMRVFGKFVINLALPVLLFRALSQRQLGDVLNVGYLLAYFAGSCAVIGLGYFWCRRISGLNPAISAFHTMGMACSNSGFVGYPILLLTAAPVAGVSLALNMTVENLFVIPFLLFLAEHRHGGTGRWRVLGRSLARLLCNPMIIGLLCGVAVSGTGLTLPAPVTRTVDMLAASSSALSLFVIGGTLVGLPMRAHGSRMAPILAGKLVLHPLMVFLAMAALPVLGLGEVEPSLRTAAVLMAAMPMMSIYATLGQVYGQEDFGAVTLLATTVASFFTLSALLLVLGGPGGFA